MMNLVVKFKKNLHFQEWIALLVIIQTFLLPVDALPGVNLIFKVLKLPVLLLLWLLFLIAARVKVPIKKWLLLLIFWVGLMAALTLRGSFWSKTHLIVASSFVLYGLLILFYTREDQKQWCDLFYWGVVLCCGITWLYSALVVCKYPLLARAMASGNIVNIRQATGGVVPKGVGGYDFVYGFVIMIPMLIYSIKKENGNKRMISCFSFAAGLFFIAVAQYTIAILLTIAFILLSNLKIRHLGLWLLGGGITAFFAWKSGLLVWGLLWLAEIFSGSYTIVERLYQLAEAIQTNVFDQIERIALYQWNIQSIIKNPMGNVWRIITGETISSRYVISDAEWLFLFSYFGVLVGAIMIAFLLCYREESLSAFLNAENRKTAQNTWLAFWLIGLINTVLRSATMPAILLFVLPLFCVVYRKKTIVAPVEMKTKVVR